MLKAPKSDSSSNFTPHPSGTFMAVCCDVFTKEVENKYKGSKDYKGNIDTRDTLTKVCISFLTEETIEIDGQTKPRYASFWAAFKMGTSEYPSNLRTFLMAWYPTMTHEQVEDMDLDKLVGKAAYLTITHSESGGKTYANVKGAAQAPKGVAAPAIPADFIRHKDKERQEVLSEVKNGSRDIAPEPLGHDTEDGSVPF